jgi:MFS family permease
MSQENVRKNPMLKIMSLRDFRLLFSGATTSLLGDQFAFIATPWLVLKLTGDPLALGIVLALEGIPRSIFMLLGGAITDRISPRIIMLLSDIIRFVLTALMALAIFTGTVQIWMLYVFGLGFGLVSGFAIPAGNSIIPMLVEERDLQAGNSMMMGTSQLVGFIGPTIAGILIGRFSQSPLGIGLAFGIDAVSFAVSAITLWIMRGGGRRQGSSTSEQKENVWDSILAGMKYLWNEKPLRVMFMVMMALNFLFVGPILVGIPVLASQRLPEGAVAFGLLMSAYAGGNLAGYLLAGSLPRPTGKTMQILLISLLAGFGLALASFGFIRTTPVDFCLMLLLGVGNGYIGITLFTWIQTRTPREMLGRMMSMIMLASTGLVPISQAASGALSKWSLTSLFAGSGAAIMLVTFWTALQPELKTFTNSMTAGQPDAKVTPILEEEFTGL